MPAVLFPGSFDPITLGHLDLLRRGCRLFGQVVIGVGVNAAKTPLFTVEERVLMIRDLIELERLPAEVESFSGLLVDFARRKGVRCVLRGLRGISDLDYERAMAMTNSTLSPEIETVFLLPSPSTSFIASRLVREIALAGRAVDHLLPAKVGRLLESRLRELRDKHS